MTQTEAIEKFEALLKEMSEGNWKALCQSAIDILETKIEALDSGWESPNFYDDAGNFTKDQAFLGLLERGAKKRELLDLITFINQFIHPEPVEGETETSPEAETG